MIAQEAGGNSLSLSRTENSRQCVLCASAAASCDYCLALYGELKDERRAGLWDVWENA